MKKKGLYSCRESKVKRKPIEEIIILLGFTMEPMNIVMFL